MCQLKLPSKYDVAYLIGTSLIARVIPSGSAPPPTITPLELLA
jgi:hypothetical protein